MSSAFIFLTGKKSKNHFEPAVQTTVDQNHDDKLFTQLKLYAFKWSSHPVCLRYQKRNNFACSAIGSTWIFQDRNSFLPLNNPQNAETKLPSNGGLPSTARAYCKAGYSHKAPRVMKHGSCTTVHGSREQR